MHESDPESGVPHTDILHQKKELDASDLRQFESSRSRDLREAHQITRTVHAEQVGLLWSPSEGMCGCG